MANLIRIFLGDFPAIMTLIALVCGIIHGSGKNLPNKAGIYLGYLFFFAMGFSGLWGFVCHAFFPAIAAQYIGWPTSPFQFEMAMANLGVGVVGLFGLRAQQSYRIAGTLFVVCLYWGAAYGHIVQMITAKNFAPGNAGFIFYNDLVMPLLLILFLLLARKRV